MYKGIRKKISLKKIREKLLFMMASGLIIISLTGCGSTQNKGNDNTLEGPKIDNTTPVISEKPDLEKETYKIGDRVSYGDISITLESVERNNGVQEGKDFSQFPANEGETFLVCNFYVENHSKKDMYVISHVYFNAYADGTELESFTYLGDIDVKGFEKDPEAGEAVKGSIVYAHVKEDFETLEIEFSPYYGDDTKIYFKANKDEIK